jgi:hypothetical protein
MSAMTRPPLVLVVWEDATELDTTAWVQDMTHDYQPDQAIVHSVGFLLHESRAGVVLTSAWCEDGQQVARREQIPKGMIRKITRLRG